MSGFDQRLQKGGLPKVVAVDEGDVFPPSGIDAHIAGNARAAILGCREEAVAMLFAHLLHPLMSYRNAIVPAMIVDQEYFEVLIRLLTKAFETRLDVGGTVVEGRNDGNHGKEVKRLLPKKACNK